MTYTGGFPGFRGIDGSLSDTFVKDRCSQTKAGKSRQDEESGDFDHYEFSESVKSARESSIGLEPSQKLSKRIRIRIRIRSTRLKRSGWKVL